MISQPTFLPWLGWFDLADQADVVVLLDTVQFEKRSWQQRNRIRTAKGLEFITVPVMSAGRYDQTIESVELAESAFGPRMLRTIRANYASAPHFLDVMSELENVVPGLVASGKLAELNEGLIRLLAKWLGIETPFQRASAFDVGGKRGEHLAMLCKSVGATDYLSTGSAEDYLREDIGHFTGRGIAVHLYEYVHPEYKQLREPFMPFASAIDLVMLEGRNAHKVMKGAKRLLRPLETRDST